MDTINIHELSVPAHIGITEEERADEQTLNVSIEMNLDLKKAAASDDVSDTIDYEAVCLRIKELGKTERNTIERFAEDIAQMILSEFKPASTQVTIDKHILPDTKSVGVTIMRP